MEEKAYSGRWVARLRGRIVAQGGTPEQARRAALSRFKENPEIEFMPTSDALFFSPMLEKILNALPPGQEIYLVGGAVRDMLLGRMSRDYDFTVVKGGIPTARKVADALQADFYSLDAERDTGRVLLTGEGGVRYSLDFAAFRGPDLDSDLTGRDFTLNAIALDPHTREIFDPLGGGMDLKEKCLRSCSPTAFADDPVRILRAVRLAADFGFHILAETRQAMKKAAPLLESVSSERIRDELFRILDGNGPAACIRALDMLGTLKVVLPELQAMKGVQQPPPHQQDVWEHVLTMLGALEGILVSLASEFDPEKAADLFAGLMVLRIGRYREQLTSHLATQLTAQRSIRALLFLAALYHDVAKPSTKKVDEEGQLRFWDHDQQGAIIVGERGRLLALSNEEVACLETIIRNHMRILFHTNRLQKEGKPPSRRAVYRFFRDTSVWGVDICLLALADLRATYGPTLPQDTWAAALDVVRLLLENWYEKPHESVAPPPLLDGNVLMDECKLPPGPKIGELLEAIREAQAMGEITTREEALVLARKKLG